MIHQRRHFVLFLAFFALTAACGAVFASVTSEEREQLKSALTPWGSERAGNREGTIPAWTGGITRLPSGVKDAAQELFPDEKPLFSITSANMDQYSGNLSEGIKAWMKKWPTYRLDIYPTHRTHATPKYIEEETFKNATRARTTDDGSTLENAVGGPAFPIPKEGVEIIWNHFTRWKGEATDIKFTNYLTTSSGNRTLLVSMQSVRDFPYSYKNMTSETLKKDYGNCYGTVTTYTLGPPDQVGNMNGGRSILDYGKRDGDVYQYLIGQRRVRVAPNVVFDAPNPGNSGGDSVDETWMYNGNPDRYNWKIIGKKEMYIPYNCNKFRGAPLDTKLSAHYYNPDVVRWELHRVWVVDATLKPGKHHVQPHRVFYVDEDSWTIALSDAYDARGAITKAQIGLLYCEANLPGVQLGSYAIYNLQSGAWVALTVEQGASIKYTARHPMSTYTADGMSRMGVR